MYIDRKDSPPNGYQSGNSHCSKNSYTYNALGSVIALTDETGAIKTQYIYDPYGNTTIIGEVNDNPFQYTGRENDGDGLLYYRARYYSPEMQRFTREDPIGFKGGINFFAYVRNNPVNLIDPDGLAGCSPDQFGKCQAECRSRHKVCIDCTPVGSINLGSCTVRAYNCTCVDLEEAVKRARCELAYAQCVKSCVSPGRDGPDIMDCIRKVCVPALENCFKNIK